MSIANADQAERWNSGEDLAHWLNNQARYDRIHEPFTTLILDAAALRAGRHVLDVGCGWGRVHLHAHGKSQARTRGGGPGTVSRVTRIERALLARVRSEFTCYLIRPANLVGKTRATLGR